MNDDLKCYRINYSRSWFKYEDPSRPGWITLPSGIIQAVHFLCDEVERLREKNHKLYRDKVNLRKKRGTK